MSITASELRSNIYKLIDEVIETGIPIKISRKGKIVKLVPEEYRPKLTRLVDRKDYLLTDPKELIHLDWSNEWQP
ncbi:MAG: type II toxin-antitoxin system Phd/YefM family antitoxin [Myxococcota bacterium]|nr:type II toxin-antitoxin system Phd/YefM family antitoxin [Myxococcota bacterium]